MKLIKKHEIQKYSGLDLLPTGNASDKITEGCIVLEGGGWKAIYSLGVTDYLMLHDINMSATVGISAGGLAGVGYISGQIGWSARIDLSYRHDPNYIGTGAMLKDHGVTGFTYLYRDILGGSPLDKKRLNDPSRRLAVGATNMLTGETEYFEKGKCNLSGAVRASATVPFVSRPVVMHGVPYLDGGCSTKIPFEWAVDEGYKKIIVVKTREWEFVRDEAPLKKSRLFYGKYPNFIHAMDTVNAKFNVMTEELKRLHNLGEIFVIAPSKPVTVTRFEKDIEKLGELYWLGYHDAEEQLEALQEYLAK